MKRFYKQAEAGTAPGGYVIRLDGKVLKTPLHRPLILSSFELANEIAAEWNAQGDIIVPASMPLFQLANTMLDKAGGPDRAAMEDETVKYGASDLVCYFAAHPADLVRRQEENWRPLVRWMKADMGVALETISGIQYMNQPKDSIRKLKELVKELEPAEFTVLQAATGITGSAVIAMAFLKGRIDVEAAYQAACVDEMYQLEKWGEDEQARQRLDKIRAELSYLKKFKNFCREK